MKIEKLILSGYKRFFLNNIEKIEYTPKEIVQIIVSRNGSGKTSLLRMLSPLPADLKKEFSDDGYKIIHITKNNKKFELSSGYYTKGKHSFKVDGNELNQSGTKKIQLTLVKEYFKLTPDMFNILLGQKNFTNMSLQERKYWLTEISNIDYGYVVNVYNKLKQRHRDIVGTAKVLQDSILKSEAMLIDNKELSKLEKDRTYINEHIEYLLGLYNNHITEDTDIPELLSKLNTKYKEFKYLYTNVDDKTNTLEYYLNTRISTKQDILNIDKQISIVTNKLSLLDKQPVDVDKLKIKIDNIKKEMSDIERYNIYNIDMNIVDKIVDMFKDIYIDIISILNTDPNLYDVDATKESLHKKKLRYDEYNKLIEVCNNKISGYKEHIDIMDKNKTSDNKITCKNCGNEWYHNYDDIKYKEYTNNIVVLKNKLNKLLENKHVIKEYDDIIRKRDILDNVRTIITSNPILKSIFIEFLKNHNIYKDNMGVLISNMDNLVINLDKLKYWSVLNGNLKELEDRYKEQLVRTDAIKKIKDTSIDSLDNELTALTTKKNELLIVILNCDKKINVLSKIKESYNDLLTTLKKAYKARNRKILYIQNQHTKSLIASLKEEVIELNDKIDTNKNAYSKYNKDKEFLQELKEKEYVLKLMLKELSPTEGLIAESISKFLNVFIEDINFVINSVWTYPMELLPTNITDTDDLSYKFEVKVDNNAIIEDVSKLSSSMQEISDLAFRVVFMKYLNLTDFPLILDEFGRTMDESHRIAAYTTIDRLMHSDFSQVFIVSHFNSVYSRFTNTDFNVLDKNNVDMGDIDKYNSCLKLVYN